MATDGIRSRFNHVVWCEFHAHAHFIFNVFVFKYRLRLKSMRL